MRELSLSSRAEQERSGQLDCYASFGERKEERSRRRRLGSGRASKGSRQPTDRPTCSFQGAVASERGVMEWRVGALGLGRRGGRGESSNVRSPSLSISRMSVRIMPKRSSALSSRPSDLFV